MKKFLTTMLVAASALLVSHAEAVHNHWGYFYLYQEQEVDSGEYIDWLQFGNVIKDLDDIYVNPGDSTHIVLEEPGVYKAFYILTVSQIDNTESSIDDGEVQFALNLNDTNIPLSGTTYAVGNAFLGAEAQLVGQAIFVNPRPYGQLAIVNQSEFDAVLENDVGTLDTDVNGNNISASIFIQKVGDIH